MTQEASREQTGSSIVPQAEKDTLMQIPGASTTTKAASSNASVPMQIADDNEATSMDLVDSTFSSPKHSLCGSIHSPVPEPTSTIQNKVNHIKKSATRVLRVGVFSFFFFFFPFFFLVISLEYSNHTYLIPDALGDITLTLIPCDSFLNISSR